VAVSTDIQVVGIKDALRELNKMDKTARRDLTKRYREVVQPVVDEISSKFPKGPPLSGFKRGWDVEDAIRAIVNDLMERVNRDVRV
jgi:hypothetical protein